MSRNRLGDATTTVAHALKSTKLGCPRARHLCHETLVDKSEEAMTSSTFQTLGLTHAQAIEHNHLRGPSKCKWHHKYAYRNGKHAAAGSSLTVY